VYTSKAETKIAAPAKCCGSTNYNPSTLFQTPMLRGELPGEENTNDMLLEVCSIPPALISAQALRF
jgi:hypothetical protein